jgi:hypothetical protein
VHLRISDHAWQRWNERVGEVKKKDIRRLVMGRLRDQLRVGITACDPEAFELSIYPDVLAVLIIDPSGCWVVKTFRQLTGKSAGSTEIEEAES